MTRPSGRTQQLVGRVLDRPFPYGYFRIFITSRLTQKSGEHLALLPIAPRFCFAYFVIVCALLPPNLFMQTAPRKYFRGAVTSAYELKISSHPEIRNYLVIPYLSFSIREKKYFDDILYPEGFEKYHFKSAIPARNRYLVEHSAYAICYVNHSWGGAATTYRRAEKQGLTLFNLAECGQ